VQDQYPVIRIGEQFYTMSLRMMKAVWWVARECLLIRVFWLTAGWRPNAC
jgi:hypothetical protein